ncbi:Zinc finger BED domain-containing protein 6, partial [Galemys pyrenaicus]
PFFDSRVAGAGRWGSGRGEWLRPPLGPGSRPSPQSQSGSLGPAGTTPPLAHRTAALARAGGSPSSRPPAPPPSRSPGPTAPAPFPANLLPSPTSGAGETEEPSEPTRSRSRRGEAASSGPTFRRRCNTFSGAGILGCVSINSSTDEEGVVEGKMVAEGMDREAKLPAKKKRKKGLRIKGKRRRKKLILAKKFSKDLGSGRPVADAPTLTSATPEQDEDSLFENNIEKQIYLPSTRAKTSIVNGSFEYIPADSLDDNRVGKKREKSISDALRAERGRFLIKSNIVKHALIPGTRAKTSAVWNFFYTDPQHISRAVCNICKRSVSRGRPGSHLGTSTLQRHLQATHPIHWAVANKDSGIAGNGLDEAEAETERNELLSDTLHGEKSTGSHDLTVEDLSDSESDEPPVLEIESRRSESPIPVAEPESMLCAQERETCENSVSSQISQAIIQMIVEDMHPYNYFSTPAFQRFMQIVAPDYRLPSETFFFTKAVPQLYDWVREKIFLTLENVQSQKIHLTVDIWTHDPSTDYFIVTVHWVSLETTPSFSNGTGITQALNLVDSLSLKLETDTLLSAMLKSKPCILAALLDPCFKNKLEDFFPQGADLETYKQILAEEVCNYMESSPEVCHIATPETSGPSTIVGTDSFTSSIREGTSNSGSIDSSTADIVAIGSKSFMFPSAI